MDDERMSDVRFGIDFGGTGIKGAPVDLSTGEFVAKRTRIPTPKESTPQVVAEIFARMLDEHPQVEGPVGVTIPGIIRRGVVGLAPNIHPSWQGVDAGTLLTEALGREVHVVNDADAAGLAEVTLGAARGRTGLVLVTTLGTGIGSAALFDGRLVPNFELGHLEIGNRVAERWAATSVREREELSWEEWAARLTTYYRHLERLFSPDLFVVGGGVSKSSEEFLPLIDIATEIVPAHLKNKAGIVGAALLSAKTARG
ncbi:polyphosphate--glucose phosphotransferase [Nocardioides gilvus]|uniref:polyphosphate--glucose phosphotransferase n=1 Tax=Nocardioides gilvus TaxID=1735589 RepID=UPI0023B790C5|nr:ROK family protein [Nocardioides gilvus]